MTKPLPVAAADVARIYKRSVAAVYTLAHRHGWRRITWQGRVYYDQHEVDATLNASVSPCTS